MQSIMAELEAVKAELEAVNALEVRVVDTKKQIFFPATRLHVSQSVELRTYS